METLLKQMSENLQENKKGTVSSEFRAIRPKLCEKCAFPQNFRARKLGKFRNFTQRQVNIGKQSKMFG